MRILITAGPTREPIDPVRFISNRSSGKMGYAVARAALRQGHETVLISGPVALPPPEQVEVLSVLTAQEMLAAIQQRLAWCEVLVMAAAVCDWRPRYPCSQKIKKLQMSHALQLKPTPDILRAVRAQKEHRIFVGFAAETRDLIKEAKRKLIEKDLDLIVANDVSQPGAGFDVDTNQVVMIGAAGESIKLPLLSKDEVAARIIQWLETRAGQKAAR
ncbi:MAG: hypothetical protein GX806_01700 [Lentisphaerae bacterium]|nr:hypothetical protein [Lentisphaerota bacterium]